MRISDWSSDVCSSDLYKSSDPYDSALNLNNRNRYEGGGGGLTIQYDLGFAKLVSSTGYRRYSFSTIADTDGSTDAADDLHLSQHGKQFTQEVQLLRSEEHTSELQSLMRISYAVFCLKKKN